MMAVQLAGEHGAGLIRVAADRDDGFHWLLQKIIHMLGMMRGNINADSFITSMASGWTQPAGLDPARRQEVAEPPWYKDWPAGPWSEVSGA